jgi:gamma-glutamyltranspeptidase / glutathione hydrolase
MPDRRRRNFQTPGRSLVYAANGMAATSHPLATKVAVDTLVAGGNAVDAALAAAFLLGICEPHMCGLAGDAFALVRRPGEPAIYGLNGSGRAPAGLDAAALRAAGLARMPEREVAAVTLPGAVDAFCTLGETWGTRPLAELVAPAIRYAEEGVPVAPRVAVDWIEAGKALAGAARRHYLLADGTPPSVGSRFRAPGQAEVLRRIARDGRAGFYEGEVADDLVASLRALGGSHGHDDLAATRADRVEPIAAPYRDHELVELPPNGQGATALLMAKILAHFDLGSLDPLGPERAHIEAEAAVLAYDARDRFVAERTPRLAHMLSDDTAARLAALIDPASTLDDPRAASESVHRDTVYLTVVDRDRMAVSLIYSLYHAFGAGLASERFGLLFQNRGAGFTLEEGHPNEAGPGKRPLHTIIPAMLRRGEALTMPFGVMGGAYQPAGHVRLISNMLDFGMDPQAAIDAPRSFPDHGTLWLETGYPRATAEALAALGHTIARRATPFGGAQAILIDEEAGVLVGASDPRKDGCALGY